MNGYIDTLREKSITVILGGHEVVITRARLGSHLALTQPLQAFDEAPGSAEMGAAIREYFGLLKVDISGASAVEVLRAFGELRELNAQKWALAFQKEVSPEPPKKEAYDYPGRSWVWLISKLASRFGWSREEIFNLHVEEALCYVQEILITEQGEKEWQYGLSELAYVYDSTTKRSRFQPLARPGWMYSPELPAPVRILKSYLPMGVMDLEGKPITYH